MSVGNFAILAFVDPIGIITTPSDMGKFYIAKVMGVSVGLLVDRVWNGGSDLQAGVEIYYWEHPEFWLIPGSPNDPFLGPQFKPPVWSIGGPISLCPQRSRT